jgi:hypothetical protein
MAVTSSLIDADKIAATREATLVRLGRALQCLVGRIPDEGGRSIWVSLSRMATAEQVESERI